MFNCLMIIFLSLFMEKLLYSKMIIKHLCYPEKKIDKQVCIGMSTMKQYLI